jgi:hypothetical protein
MERGTYETKYVELVGMNGPSVEHDLNEWGKQRYRLVAYDVAKHVAVFERKVVAEVDPNE